MLPYRPIATLQRYPSRINDISVNLFVNLFTKLATVMVKLLLIKNDFFS